MAVVLVGFDEWFPGPDGRQYQARICGRGREDGLHEGWIEFVAADGEVVRTGRETTQPNSKTLEYWASGLTAGYLDGALRRTLTPKPTAPPRAHHPRPAFEGPAPAGSTSPGSIAANPPRPVLDPFAVYAEGDHVLHGQLEALNEGQLRTIVRAYALGDLSESGMASFNRYELAHHILAEVCRRAGP